MHQFGGQIGPHHSAPYFTMLWSQDIPRLNVADAESRLRAWADMGAAVMTAYFLI